MRLDQTKEGSFIDYCWLQKEAMITYMSMLSRPSAFSGHRVSGVTSRLKHEHH